MYGGEGKVESFEDFHFSEEIMDGIAGMNYEKPSKIQSFAIPILLKGKDLMMQSQSGSGKTMAFLLSALQKIDPKKSSVPGNHPAEHERTDEADRGRV